MWIFINFFYDKNLVIAGMGCNTYVKIKYWKEVWNRLFVRENRLFIINISCDYCYLKNPSLKFHIIHQKASATESTFSKCVGLKCATTLKTDSSTDVFLRFYWSFSEEPHDFFNFFISNTFISNTMLKLA